MIVGIKITMKKITYKLFFLISLFMFILFLHPLSRCALSKEFLWENNYGGIQADISAEIILSGEKNFIIVGETHSKGAGNSDAWVLKLDEEGNILWDKTYGGEENDGAFSVVEAEGQSYIICGYTWSNGKGKDDGWVIKIDQNGKVLWERTFGKDDRDRLYSLIGDHDKGYVAVGYTDRVFCSLCSEQGYVWVIKMDETGEQIWEKKFGGSTYDMAYDLIQHEEEGYVIVAKTKDKLKETSAACLLKLDQKGNIEDRILIDRDKDNYFKSITKSKDEEYYFVIGDTWSKSIGNSDIWLMKLTK